MVRLGKVLKNIKELTCNPWPGTRGNIGFEPTWKRTPISLCLKVIIQQYLRRTSLDSQDSYYDRGRNTGYRKNEGGKAG